MKRRDFLKKTSLTLVGSFALSSSAGAEQDQNIELLLAKPIEKIRPDWLNGAEDYKLPEFFDSCRVQAHTRMKLSVMREKPEKFYSLADNFKTLGVRVFTRHIKSATEGAWWPSKLEKIVPEARDKNIAKIIIDNAHRNGQNIIAYHRHMEDEYWCEKHPDWISRLPDGSPVVHRPDLPRKKLCFNSPYADAYLVRALELVDLGVDGFYFDSWHQSKKGCWCGYCKKKFKQETGLDLPKKIKPADPVYRKLLEYKNVILERTFLRYRKEFHKRNPNLVMIVGSNTWPSMSDTHQNSRLWRIVDSQKTEFTLASRANLPKKMLPFNKNVKNVHGWVLARDATGGRPPHIWIPRLRDESTVTYSAAAAVAHGCIANSDNGGDQIPNSMFKKAYQFGDSVSPYFAGTKPLRYVALHYSEHARKSYTTDKYQAWANVLYPNYAAFLALLRARLPVGIVTDSQLEDDLLNDFQVLFIPDRKNLTAKMKSVVNDFKAKGGQVIYNSPDYKWHQADGQQAAIKKFIAQIETGPTTPPVKVTGGPNKMQTDSFLNKEKNRLTVTCVNDFSWIKLEILKNATPEQKRKTKQIKLPKPCSGAKIILKGKFAAEPKKLFNAVIGKELNFTKVGDAIKVDVPDFEALAVVVAQY